MKTFSIIICLLAVLGLTSQFVVLPAISTERGSVNSALPVATALPVDTCMLTAVDSIKRERQLSGTIVPARRVQLGFERSARLQQVFIDEGAQVKAGQVLAILDQRQLKTSLEELTARRQQQVSILAELEAGPRAETIGAAAAELEAMKADSELRKSTLDRTLNLFDRKSTSLQQLDEARLSFQSAAARREAASRRLDELKAGTRPEQMSAQRAAIAVLDAQLRSLQIEIEDSELKSPFDGLISRRMADEGDIPGPRQQIMELLETGRLEAHIGVPVSLLGGLSSDGYQILTANGNEFTGNVRSVIPELNPVTRTQTVIIELDRSHPPEIAIGQLVRMQIHESVPVSGFRVPLAALSSGTKGLWSVFVLEASEAASTSAPGFRAVSRIVEVVHSDGRTAIIRGAVYDGEHVVATGAHRLASDQLVVPASVMKSSQQSASESMGSADVPNEIRSRDKR